MLDQSLLNLKTPKRISIKNAKNAQKIRNEALFIFAKDNLK